MFSEFVGKNVKAPYKDGSQFKIARGVVESVTDTHVSIKGDLGRIVIHVNDIRKMSETKNGVN